MFLVQLFLRQSLSKTGISFKRIIEDLGAPYIEGVTDNRIVTVTPEYFTPDKSGYYTYSTYFRPNDFDIELRLRFDNTTYGNFILCKANSMDPQSKRNNP